MFFFINTGLLRSDVLIYRLDTTKVPEKSSHSRLGKAASLRKPLPETARGSRIPIVPAHNGTGAFVCGPVGAAAVGARCEAGAVPERRPRGSGLVFASHPVSAGMGNAGVGLVPFLFYSGIHF